MSDDENFLSRWARRKRDVAKEEERVQPPAPARAPDKEGQPPDTAAPAAKAPELPEFDLSQLPSLDSIGATSDITAFLQPGVPSALKHAALRRAWVADPAIRDFIGPADYAWDFTAPDAMPGFGALGVDDDVQKILTDLFRDADAKPEPAPRNPPAEAVQPEAESAQPGSPTAEIARAPAAPPAATPSERDDLLHHEENIASQQDENSSEPVAPPSRRHGGAMPQ